jgi:hypothetical protein
MPVCEHPAQELQREENAEQQVDYSQPGRVSDKGGCDEIGDGSDVDGKKAALERHRSRAVAIEQAPQVDAEAAE